jgi:hypothetical protein
VLARCKARRLRRRPRPMNHHRRPSASKLSKRVGGGVGLARRPNRVTLARLWGPSRSRNGRQPSVTCRRRPRRGAARRRCPRTPAKPHLAPPDAAESPPPQPNFLVPRPRQCQNASVNFILPARPARFGPLHGSISCAAWRVRRPEFVELCLASSWARPARSHVTTSPFVVIVVDDGAAALVVRQRRPGVLGRRIGTL